MKVVYMGTPDFAVDTLQAIVDAGHEVALVVTQPDKAKGRGKKLCYTPVKEKAMECHLEVAQPEKVREESFVERLQVIAPDVIVVVAFGQILPESILNIPKYGCINVHASLLPAYRGAAPIQWAVIDGLAETGVTTMYMEKGLDTGDIICQSRIPLAADETGGSLFDKLAKEGASLLVRTLKMLEDGTATRTKQDDSRSSYAKMLSGAAPGTVIAVDKKSFTVRCGNGALRIYNLQLEGKKRMDTSAFLLGYKVENGMQLGGR